MTELENTKTDLEYFQKAKNKVAKEKEELEEEILRVKKESREQILSFDKQNSEMSVKLKEAMKKDVIIKQLELENQRLRSSQTQSSSVPPLKIYQPQESPRIREKLAGAQHHISSFYDF